MGGSERGSVGSGTGPCLEAVMCACGLRVQVILMNTMADREAWGMRAE